MSRIKKPYYNLHQIILGRYSSGDEFVLRNGEIYTGSYHILPSGQRFTGFQPEPKSVELFEIRLNPTIDILRYNQITGNEINKYISPISYQPLPTSDDYKIGKIQRFFVQKRNSPDNTIIEIDSKQFNSINTQNNPGINGVLWNKLIIDWIISKIPYTDTTILNGYTIQKSLPSFPSLNSFIQNLNEFYK